jgi:hypothetical protein
MSSKETLRIRARSVSLGALFALAATLAFLGGSTHHPALAAVPSGPPVFSNPLVITNKYQPFQPGGIKVYRGTTGSVREVAVDLYLADARTVGGVPCRILEETAFEGGQLVEVSRNFFAQADDGTVYYFGEIVDIYEDGVVTSHEGSWLVGGPTLPSDPTDTADAPAPTVFMPATPELGDIFKQEDLFPTVDETDQVIAVDRTVRVEAGRFKGTIKILESSQLIEAPRRSGTPPASAW